MARPLEIYNEWQRRQNAREFAQLWEVVDLEGFRDICIGLSDWTTGYQAAFENLTRNILTPWADLQMTVEDLIEPPALCPAYYRHCHPEHDHRVDRVESSQHWPAKISGHFNQGHLHFVLDEEQAAQQNNGTRESTGEGEEQQQDRDGIEPVSCLHMDGPPGGTGEDAQASQKRLHYNAQCKEPGDEDIQALRPSRDHVLRERPVLLGLHGTFSFSFFFNRRMLALHEAPSE